MAMLGEMFRVNPEKAAGALASVFLELLLQKDCYLRALRILLREIVRLEYKEGENEEFKEMISGV